MSNVSDISKMSSCSDEIASDIEESANKALNALIPQKSKARYDAAYQKFEEWCQTKKVTVITEKVMLAYFETIKAMKASTMWTTYSMLKSELKVKKDVNIQTYTTLIALLKRRSVGYHAKKSKVFSREQFETFIKEADDKHFLFAKVAIIIGIAGACRKAELTFLRVKDVIDEKSFFRITIPETKTHVIREFIVNSGNISGINMLDIIRKYICLRPQITKHERFFVGYRESKCSVQPVEINTFGKLPRTIAQFLGLPNLTEYTGHCFRRTVAEGYVENSLGNKKRIAQDIMNGESELEPASKRLFREEMKEIRTEKVRKELGETSGSALNFVNCTLNNPVFNIFKE